MDAATVLAVGTVATGLLTGGGGILVSLRNRRSDEDEDTERERNELRAETRKLRRENSLLYLWVDRLIKSIRQQGGDLPDPPPGLDD